MAKKTKSKPTQKKSAGHKAETPKKAGAKVVKVIASKQKPVQKPKQKPIAANNKKSKSKVPVKAKVTPKKAVKSNIQAVKKSIVATTTKKTGAKVNAPLKSQPVLVKTKPEILKTIKTPEKVKEKNLTPVTGTGLKLRYSDKDLVEFKGIILEKLAEARHDLVLLRSSMSHLDDHGTDDTSPTFKLMEDGSDVLTKEETAQLAARQQKFIKHLEDALIRIENKSYGICRVTGNLIPKERLRVVPHATLSIEAKQKQF